VALYRSQRYGAWREASEVFLTAQQAMHGTGFLGTFPFLAMGLPQVLVDRFDAAAVLGAIQRHKVTATMLVPAMLNGLLAEAPSDRALGSLRHLLYGGGPMSADDIGAAAQRLGHAMAQVYGRVEGGWPLTVLGPVAHVAMRSGASRLARSCGRPIAEVSTRLRPLPEQPGDTGELLVKSAMTSADYVGADGWCSLGDVMRRDEEGYLYFERRLDRMINTGYHVYPDEIEAVIRGIGGVAGVRVVGEPHPRWGEMVVAYIVPTAERVEPAQLRQAVAQRLAKYKVPREFRIVDRLPP
jgi:acyl-CoA synthetase (AMP-forming)/AMP-acid ligase II